MAIPLRAFFRVSRELAYTMRDCYGKRGVASYGGTVP
jgi:hypothetical protein